MQVMEVLHQAPSLVQRVPRRLPHSGPLVGRVLGSCAGTRGQDTGRRANLPRHVARKQHAGSPSCTLSSWFYIISRHQLGTAATNYATQQEENNNNNNK